MEKYTTRLQKVTNFPYRLKDYVIMSTFQQRVILLPTSYRQGGNYRHIEAIIIMLIVAALIPTGRSVHFQRYRY